MHVLNRKKNEYSKNDFALFSYNVWSVKDVEAKHPLAPCYSTFSAKKETQ